MLRWLVPALFAVAACNGLRMAAENATPFDPNSDAGAGPTGAQAAVPFTVSDGGGTFLPPPPDAGTSDARPDPSPPPTCDGGLCTPEKLSSIAFANRLILVGDDLYIGGNGLARCPKSDCSAPVVLLQNVTPREFVVVGDTLYWVTFFNAELQACAVNGCNNTPTTLLGGRTNLHGLVSDGTNLYFSDDDGLHRCPLANCSDATTVALLDGEAIHNNGALSLSDGAIVWGDLTDSVSTCPTTGTCTPAVLGLAADDVWADDRHALWITNNQVAVCGGAGVGCNQSPLLFPATTNPHMPMSDGTNVYFIDQVRYVARCPLTGCPPEGVEVIADLGALNHLALSPVAVDADYVYWATPSGIYRLAKH